MSLERSNGYAEGRDSLRWALDKMRKLETENEELKRQLARMREVMECNDPGNVPEA